MATRVAIAQMRDNALAELRANMNEISALIDVDPAAMPIKTRDPDYTHAAELKAIAEWSGRVKETLKTPLAIEGNADGNTTQSKNAKSHR